MYALFFKLYTQSLLINLDISLNLHLYFKTKIFRRTINTNGKDLDPRYTRTKNKRFYGRHKVVYCLKIYIFYSKIPEENQLF